MAYELLPGQTVTVTVVTTGTASAPLLVHSAVDGHDGLTRRGPWQLDTVIEGYLLWLPLLFR